jgi:ribonuclease HI
MKHAIQIYTDASTAVDERAGIAMVIVAENSLNEYTDVLTGVHNAEAEQWAVLWAVEYLVQNRLDGMVLTDCAATAHVWQQRKAAAEAGPARQLVAYSISHSHLLVRHCKRGTTIFNRRADCLARSAMRGSENREGLGCFLSQHAIHAACLAARAKQGRMQREYTLSQI